MRSIVIALFVLFGSFSAQAIGLPMMQDLRPVEKANVILADLIETALKADPAGNAIIEVSHCTTPNHFFRAIRTYHPGARLQTVSALPAYLRSLQFRIDRPASGKYRMTRILTDAEGSKQNCRLDTEGWKRSFQSGEGAWYDANLGAIVLAGDCSNVVSPPEPVKAVAVAPPAPPQAVIPQVQAGGCPDTLGLKLNVWTYEDLLRGHQEAALELIAIERARGTAPFAGKSFSRTLGGLLRRFADDGTNTIVRKGSVKVDVYLSAYDSNGYPIEGQEKHLGSHIVSGQMRIDLPAAEVRQKAIRLVVQNDPKVLSPVIWSFSGKRDLLLYPQEWGTYCNMNLHILVGTR